MLVKTYLVDYYARENNLKKEDVIESIKEGKSNGKQVGDLWYIYIDDKDINPDKGVNKIIKSQRWFDTESGQDISGYKVDFWVTLKNDIDTGEFWADRIKRYKGEPLVRLRIALDNLPLPAAFRESAVALRAIIREKRKNKEDYEEELSFLYWLAALRSFILDYAQMLKEPGFSVIEMMPAKRVKSLPFEYEELGYEKLELLNKTDCKWIVDKWGEPEKHSTLNELHEDVWNEYENLAIKEREKEREESWSSLLGSK